MTSDDWSTEDQRPKQIHPGTQIGSYAPQSDPRYDRLHAAGASFRGRLGILAANIHASGPFDCRTAPHNLSGDANQDYFSDGTTEELITNVAQIHGLKVISRTLYRARRYEEAIPHFQRAVELDPQNGAA
jgi:tetratricopeptide (TPR) repeat protein